MDVADIAKGIVQADPAERLGKVLKPLRKGRQPAIEAAFFMSLRRAGLFDCGDKLAAGEWLTL